MYVLHISFSNLVLSTDLPLGVVISQTLSFIFLLEPLSAQYTLVTKAHNILANRLLGWQGAVWLGAARCDLEPLT